MTTPRKERNMTEGYQGYANFPTFTIALWIDNNRRHSALIREAARAYRSREEYPDVRTAEYLQEYIERSFREDGVQLALDNSGSVASTLLSHVMTQVDWLGLARKYLEDED